jgi:alpha-tubulin suppressor-like RCC1 family protein
MFGHAYRPILLDHHKLGIYTLACGGWHTLGLTTNGNVYVWGANTDNNLGVEGVVKITTPYLLLEGKNIINMFTGRSYSNYVQSKDGTMYVWGKNSNFQFFGNEHAEIITTPMIYEELRDLPIRNVFVGIEASIFTLETRIRGFVIKNSAALADVYITCR